MFPPYCLQNIYVLDQVMVQQMVCLLVQRNFWTMQLEDLVDELHGQLLQDLFHVPFHSLVHYLSDYAWDYLVGE